MIVTNQKNKKRWALRKKRHPYGHEMFSIEMNSYAHQ